MALANDVGVMPSVHLPATAFVLAPTALIALFSAQGATELATVSLREANVRSSVEAARLGDRRGPRASASFHSTSSASIVDRNPFDSHARARPQVVADSPDEAPACAGVRVLAIVASSDPEWSFAALSEGTSSKPVLRRRGGDLGARRVAYIAWDRVWLSTGSELCASAMFADPLPDEGAKEKEKERRPASSVDPAITQGIRQVSPTDFEVERRVIERILQNQSELLRSVRVTPEQVGGKLVGIRLGLRPDTVLGVLGMKDGDRLQTINGYDMTNPESALEAFARLRYADHLSLRLFRGGRDVEIRYDIR